MSKIREEEIILNEPRIYKTSKGRVVKVRDVRPIDRYRARKKARECKFYKYMTEDEKRAFEIDLLMLEIIEEPKISLEEYLEASEIELAEILRIAFRDYMERLSIVLKGTSEFRRFLQRMREEGLLPSTISSQAQDMTGTEQESST